MDESSAFSIEKITVFDYRKHIKNNIIVKLEAGIQTSHMPLQVTKISNANCRKYVEENSDFMFLIINNTDKIICYFSFVTSNKMECRFKEKNMSILNLKIMVKKKPSLLTTSDSCKKA